MCVFFNVFFQKCFIFARLDYAVGLNGEINIVSKKCLCETKVDTTFRQLETPVYE
jgi:hypothetical protein